MAKYQVRMWAAYLEEPIMIKDSDIFLHVDVGELPVSSTLKSDIQAWDEEYQDTFDENDPLNSGFATQEQKMEHRIRGANLSKRLQDELGNLYKVEWVDTY